MARLMDNKVETSLWLTRVLTVFFGLLFILPFMGGDQASLYQRIFLTAAATAALRLHQRAARPLTFSREFFGALVLEDSCHYLFFSLIFYHTAPVTLAVLPVTLFALLHATSFTLLVVDEVGPHVSRMKEQPRMGHVTLYKEGAFITGVYILVYSFFLVGGGKEK